MAKPMLCRTETLSDPERSNQLMDALDRINRTQGRVTIPKAALLKVQHDGEFWAGQVQTAHLPEQLRTH